MRRAASAAVGTPLALETDLSRSDCDRRLRGRFDDALWRVRPDPNRPVKGRASLDGFTVRPVTTWTKSPLTAANGTYLLGPNGRTRIEIRFGIPWDYVLPWILFNAILFAALFGLAIVFLPLRGVDGVPAVRFALGAILMLAILLAVQLGILAYLVMRYGGEQRAFLRSFLEGTLAAR